MDDDTICIDSEWEERIAWDSRVQVSPYTTYALLCKCVELLPIRPDPADLHQWCATLQACLGNAAYRDDMSANTRALQRIPSDVWRDLPIPTIVLDMASTLLDRPDVVDTPRSRCYYSSEESGDDISDDGVDPLPETSWDRIDWGCPTPEYGTHTAYEPTAPSRHENRLGWGTLPDTERHSETTVRPSRQRTDLVNEAFRDGEWVEHIQWEERPAAPSPLLIDGTDSSVFYLSPERTPLPTDLFLELSNDIFYRKETARSTLVHGSIARRLDALHYTPSLSVAQARSLYRPVWEPRLAPQHEPVLAHVEDGACVALFEYTEQQPVVCSKVGMCSKIVDYYRSPTLGVTPPGVHRLEHDAASPFLFGDIVEGKRQCCLENNMVTAPVEQYQSTDFLLTISPDGTMSIRRVDHAYAVGQVQARVDVPAPGSVSADRILRGRVGLSLSRAPSADGFPTENTTRVSKHARSYRANPSRYRCTPEDLCLYESMVQWEHGPPRDPEHAPWIASSRLLQYASRTGNMDVVAEGGAPGTAFYVRPRHGVKRRRSGSGTPATTSLDMRCIDKASATDLLGTLGIPSQDIPSTRWGRVGLLKSLLATGDSLHTRTLHME